MHAKVDVHGARFGLISELTAFSFSEMPLRCVVPSHYIDRAQHRNSRRSLAMLMQERTAASASHTAYAIANAHAPKRRCRYSHVHSLSTHTNTSVCTQHAPILCCTLERAWVIALKLVTLRLAVVQACMACRVLASMPHKH